MVALLNKGYEPEIRYFVDNIMDNSIDGLARFKYFNKCWGLYRKDKTIASIRKKMQTL